MPKKSLTSKIWSSLIGKIVLMGVVFGFFYIIGDSLHIIPASAKDFVSFMADNFNTFAFLFLLRAMRLCCPEDFSIKKQKGRKFQP